MENGAFRKKRVYFSQVSNSALRDNTLSLKAKGLYALIQSYITIEGFTLYKSMLLKECKESKTAFDGAWEELKANGYLKQYRIRAEGGMFCYEYELLDAKEAKSAESPNARPQPQNPGADNPGDGKTGVYSNTESNNTLPNNIQSTRQHRDKNVTLPTACKSENGVTDGTADAGHQKAELETFSPELEQFVDFTYTALFMQYMGYQHPHLQPYQRYRTLQILRDYLRDYDEDIETLEATAEQFLSDSDCGDGNILAFANPEVIENRLNRL